MSAIIPKISKLSNRVIRVLGCNPGPMTLQGTNTYLIGTGDRRFLLDTGEPNITEYIVHLDEVLRSENISIVGIIISHWHQDHIGGVSNVKNLIRNPDCEVYKFKSIDPVDEKKGLNFIKNDDVLTTEGATIRILHTPGHTGDHICLYLEEDQSLFCGDCILGEGSSVFEDLHSYMASLEKIKTKKPTTLYPGHGPVIEDPSGKIDEYINHRNKRENQIMAAIVNARNTISVDEIVRIVYQETPLNLLEAAASNVRHHLHKLKKDGKIIETEAGGVMVRESFLERSIHH